MLESDVHTLPVAILHGNLNVEIQTSLVVSQPEPLSQGTTQVTPQTTVDAKEEKARNVVLRRGATVEELVRALAAIGSTPRDVIMILQTLRSAGALEAEIEVILTMEIVTVSPSLLTTAPAGSPKNADPAKIHEAAQQFEALLLGQLLHSVHPSGGWLGSGEELPQRIPGAAWPYSS